MMVSNILKFSLFVLIFVVRLKATTIDEAKQRYEKILMDCAQENPITPADIEQLKMKIMPDNKAAKCLFACAYKRSGMMDSDGKLSIEGVQKISKEIYENDPDRMQKAEQFTEACKSVNDQAVSDGAEGCDRAALILKCSFEKAPEFDFAV